MPVAKCIWASQALLTELARARLHGFSEREVEIALALEMSEVESLWLERDQIYAEVSESGPQ